MMMKKFLLILWVTFFIVSRGFGQTGQTGAVNGTVTDPDGISLPGVTVILESPALVLPQLTTITNTHGVYRFLMLAPGEYRLTFQLEGLNTAYRKGIIVNIGKTSTVDVKMMLKSIGELVVVQGKFPGIDRQKNTGTANLDNELLEMIPTPGRTVMDYFNLTPGINDNIAHGSGEMENSYNLDGVNMGDPVTSTELVTFAMDTMEEVAVQTGGLSAEYGSVKGAVLNVVTKSGGNRLNGSLAFYYDNENLQSDNTKGTDLYNPVQPEKTGRKFQIEPGFSLGGPIIKNKLWFFGHLSMISREQYVPGYPHDRPPAESIPVDEKEYFPYIKFTFQPSKADKFMFSYNYSDLRTNHRGASRFYNEDTTQVQTTPTHVFNAHWTRNFGKNWYGNLKLAYVKSNLNLRAKKPGPQYGDWLTGLQTGTNWRNRDDNQRNRYQLNLDITTFIDNLAGSHELKIGAELQAAKTAWIMEINPDPGKSLAWIFYWPELVGGNGIYYGFHMHPFDRKEDMLNYSLFLNDTWNVSRNLTLNIGVRFDYNSVIWPPQNQDENPPFNPWGLRVDRRIYNSITALQWKNLSPRLGFIYDIFADGSTLVKASWGRYVIPNAIQWVNLAHPNGWYYWTEVYYGYEIIVDTLGLVAPTGTQVGYKDHDLEASTADELTVGIERQMWEDWSLGIRYIKKWDKNLIHAVDAAALDIDALMDNGELVWRDWEKVQITDPYDGSTATFYNNLDPYRHSELYIVNPPGAERKYDGLEVTLNKRYSHGWSLNASYVYANSRGLIALNRNDIDGTQSLGTSDLWVNPNAHINAEGRFPYERRHQLKITGLVNGPWGISIGGYFRHLSGQRWTRYITSSFLGLKLNQLTETIKAEQRGTNGYPAINILDLRLQKTFKLGKIRLNLFADIFNVFNDNTVVEKYLDSSNPVVEFGEDLSIVPPRVVRLGAKIEF